jgi:hypothetical protein
VLWRQVADEGLKPVSCFSCLDGGKEADWKLFKLAVFHFSGAILADGLSRASNVYFLVSLKTFYDNALNWPLSLCL